MKFKARARQMSGIAMLSLACLAVAQNVPPNGVLPPDNTPAQMAFNQQLAFRFRPYVKTSRDGSTLETRRPAKWQWMLAQPINVVQEYQSTTDPGCAGHGTGDKWPTNGTFAYHEINNAISVVLPSDINNDPNVLLTMPSSDIRNGGSVADSPSYALHFTFGDSYTGEDWQSVVTLGDGIYAHVEQIIGGLFNIEYTILWAYNDAYCAHHVGDITTMTVVYDQNADLITRLTYSVHGYAIESFRIIDPVVYSVTQITGEDDSDNMQSVSVIEINVDPGNEYQEGGSAHQRGSPMVLIAQDPVTAMFEHPVAFAERGSHELWPNRTGSITAAPKHSGTGFGFLPDVVNVLDPRSDNNPDAPFLFFNGKFGSDPNSIMLHRTWYWPEGRAEVDGHGCGQLTIPNGYGCNRFAIPEKRFTDKDPYINMSSTMPWPPNVEYAGSAPTAFVNPQQIGENGAVWTVDTEAISITSHRIEKLNDSTQPFPDPFSGISVVPCGSTLIIAAGTYPRRGTFARQCGGMAVGRPIILKATGGVVTLGSVSQ